jgi:hypothetical protein
MLLPAFKIKLVQDELLFWSDLPIFLQICCFSLFLGLACPVDYLFWTLVITQIYLITQGKIHVLGDEKRKPCSTGSTDPDFAMIFFPSQLGWFGTKG